MRFPPGLVTGLSKLAVPKVNPVTATAPVAVVRAGEVNGTLADARRSGSGDPRPGFQGMALDGRSPPRC